MKKLLLFALLALASAGIGFSQEIIQESPEVALSAAPQGASTATKVNFRGYINKCFQLTTCDDGGVEPYILSLEASLGAKIEDYVYVA